MDNADGVEALKKKITGQGDVVSEEEEDDDDEEGDSDDDDDDEDDDDDTIARIRRSHYAQAAAMSRRQRAPPRPRPMSQKRKIEAVKNFHDFTKKLKKDTGISIRGIVGKNILDFGDLTSEESVSESDGLSEEEFVVNPNAVKELNEDDGSYIDPETGDIVENKKKELTSLPLPTQNEPEEVQVPEEPKTLSISDLINEGDLDSRHVEIAEVEESELCPDKTAEELLGMKQEENSQDDFDITDKLENMCETSAEPKIDETEEGKNSADGETKPENEEEKKTGNAVNIRRNIREVMDEKQLDASTLAAQRQESERLARVQEQQKIIREVQRQIAMNRQNKVHQKTLSLLQGSSLLKKSGGQKLNLPNTVVMKVPTGEAKKMPIKPGQVEVTRVTKAAAGGSTTVQKVMKPDQKSDKKEVVEIVDSSSGDDSSSSSSDSDDCIMLSDSEVPPSPEAEDDPGNSGLHVNDAYNQPDEQGRVQINIGHPENEKDIFLAPQIARIIKPHQIGGVRFLFDNIIESVERFSTSTGFGCILAHSMGLGKTLQIVCFCDIFLRHTASKTVLCIMPINTLQNWVAEFNKWLPVDQSSNPLSAQGEVRTRNFPIYVLNDSHKTLQMRAKVVKDWTSTGGVLMIGYELYRLLSMKKDKKPRKKKKAELKAEAEKEKEDKKNEKPDANDDTQFFEKDSDVTNQSKLSDDKDEPDAARPDKDKDERKEDAPNDEEKKLFDEMYEALVKPGPDLVICDEGHRIKNSHSNISYALKQMRTKRRVVLTGYPLQNNMLEYWCMVDFVRPNYLGSKTEFCNMFERPIQNGQCIDSTPQDIRLMRYRAHVLHSLLVGFVQRRSHAVLQSTLPQKEEYVMLIRMTPLQRKLYDRFMNEVVRSTSVPNPLKAFAICCKIWNHPDVLYHFLRKRSEQNAAIEEDLDLEELAGGSKAGRARAGRAAPRRAGKARGAGKKPAATIPPNTSSTGPPVPYNSQYPNGPPYGPPGYRPDQPERAFPPYSNYQNQGQYYPPNQGYNPNYGNNYYPQQQPPVPYANNYPNQYPANNTDPSFNQNYWANGNYYNDPNYYNNSQYPNSQPPANFSNQQYPPNYNAANEQTYPATAPPAYPNQDPYANQQRPPFTQGPYQNPTYPGNGGYNANAAPPAYPAPQPQNYPNQQYPPYPENSGYPQNNPAPTAPYNQYESRPAYPGYPNQSANASNAIVPKTEPGSDNYLTNGVKSEVLPIKPGPYPNAPYNYNQQNPPPYETSRANADPNFPPQYPGYPPQLETKPPLDSPVTSWPIPEMKPELDRLSELKAEAKTEVKSESDGEVKIEDLDTKTIVKDGSNIDPKLKSLSPKEAPKETKPEPEKKEAEKAEKSKNDAAKSSESEEEVPRGRGRPRGKGNKRTESKRGKGKSKAKGRKDRKNSKDKGESESDESEKEEKMNKEEELALAKKAEEVTYDWATELLKDYIPGIIENSAKMELFFYILNESIKMGDRILLFSQSLFTLNLIEDFLERNYIPGTNCPWERNTNYYRLDGSTHALEREKLINEFNTNPHVYLFLVSTRAGSLGINLVGANRVIVFDASWNPCHDTQAVCRVYRYGQKKPCFVYRFVMDCCLEKKIYDRQINKQGMADRVVDECNPDAVLSMKEITNLCFDNDEKETEAKELSEHKDKYIDVIMQGIIGGLGTRLSKEPFQHESLLVDRKEKKLSSAEKRLAQRGYELEKKAANAPKPTTAYRTVRTADGSLVQRPVASVRPMQHGARWIPADVWRRQGMTAQEMTLPLDVVIPTNSAEKTNIVLKAGQRVMVLKSPKGIYMQLESGKIIAIKTSLKGLQKGADAKDGPKKIMGNRPTSASLPGSLKNNSAITITSKSGPRPMQRVITRPIIGQHKVMRPMMPGQRDMRVRMAEMRGFGGIRKLQMPQRMRPALPGSVSITKVTKDTKKAEDSRLVASDDEPQVLDSDDDESETDRKDKEPQTNSNNSKDSSDNKTDEGKKSPQEENSNPEPLVLTTEEKLPSESALGSRHSEDRASSSDDCKMNDKVKSDSEPSSDHTDRPKVNLLKNYRHQRTPTRALESSLLQLERTAISLNKESLPDFRKNLDDITQSYSPTNEERPASKSRKKKPPNKIENSESQSDRLSMSHSVSSLLGPGSAEKARPAEVLSPAPGAPIGAQRIPSHPPFPSEPLMGSSKHPAPSLGLPLEAGGVPGGAPAPGQGPPPDGHYGQYPPGYAYGGYPSSSYYGGYAPPYYGGYAPPYPAAPAPAPALALPPAPPLDPYLPPNPQW